MSSQNLPIPATLESIWISPEAGAAMHSVEEAMLDAGVGILGDRYHSGTGSFSRWPGSGRAVTLIAAEALEAIASELGYPLPAGSTRRNLVTRGVDLHELLGRNFKLGEAILRGDRTCEPCALLDRRIQAGVCDLLRQRGGIRASIVQSGVIRVGNAVTPFGPKAHLP